MRRNVVNVIGGKSANDLKWRIAVLITAAMPFFTGVARAAANDAQAAAGCAACGGGLTMMILLPLIIQVAILVWVVKDARVRGIESPLGWMVFVFFVPLVGILVYLFSRPPIKTQ